MTEQQALLLICDASHERGTGHVMRMITLGAALQDGGSEVTIAAQELPQSLRNLVRLHGLRLIDRQTKQTDLSLAHEIPTLGYSAIVIDGYGFNQRVFEDLMERGERVIVIDDNGDHATVPCSMIVNPNLHALPSMYAANPSNPVLLLGAVYALIRPEIRSTTAVPILERDGVVLSLGGSDILGRRAEIEDYVRRHRPWSVTSAKGLIGSITTTADALAKIMATSRIGLIAVGTTTWEALCLGLPIVGVVVADNQVLISDSLTSIDLAEVFDLRHTFDLAEIVRTASALYDSPELLQSRSARGQSVVDGLGAVRVAKTILAL